MCYMLYLGAHHELPLIDPPNWSEIDWTADDWTTKVPRLVVTSLLDSQVPVRQQLSGMHVVYAGSYEGCGCGFNWLESGELDDNNSKVVVGKESRIALSNYIETNQVSVLFGCWAGDEEEPIAKEIKVTIQMLADPSFDLLERVLMRVVHAISN
jgi:hypothetical protein